MLSKPQCFPNYIKCLANKKRNKNPKKILKISFEDGTEFTYPKQEFKRAHDANSSKKSKCSTWNTKVRQCTWPIHLMIHLPTFAMYPGNDILFILTILLAVLEAKWILTTAIFFNTSLQCPINERSFPSTFGDFTLPNTIIYFQKWQKVYSVISFF